MVMQNTITAEAKGSTDGANARAKLADIGRGLMASAGATCEARKRTFDRACGSGGLPTMVNRFLLLHTAIDACLCTRRADAPLRSGASPRLPGMVNSGSGISVTVSSAAAGNSESAPAPVALTATAQPPSSLPAPSAAAGIARADAAEASTALTATAQPPSSLRAPSAAAGLAHADDSEASTASAADVPMPASAESLAGAPSGAQSLLAQQRVGKQRKVAPMSSEERSLMLMRFNPDAGPAAFPTAPTASRGSARLSARKRKSSN
jgi:hypothetical protein